MNARWIALLAVLGLAACSAEISTVELNPQLSPNKPVNGLPYRVKEPYVVELYKKTDKGYVRVNADATTTMANPDRLYLLEHTGQPFSDATTKYEVDADGTLKSVKLNTTNGAAKAAETATSTIGTIEASSKAADEAREKALSTAETAHLNYAKAKAAVRTAEAKLAALPSGASELDRTLAENALLEAQINANIAARHAGIERPYPDLTY